MKCCNSPPSVLTSGFLFRLFKKKQLLTISFFFSVIIFKFYPPGSRFRSTALVSSNVLTNIITVFFDTNFRINCLKLTCRWTCGNIQLTTNNQLTFSSVSQWSFTECRTTTTSTAIPTSGFARSPFPKWRPWPLTAPSPGASPPSPESLVPPVREKVRRPRVLLVRY